ncbi:MAG: rhodanese-like domain-containing protein [Brumimicrobium sp.]|nr:rhodanese-like domain-containing protein [Brumimicrobium sp.]MCO5267287.1 rhodanese-like domain-containing protein [Brumimicrobium sp.]
MADKQLIIDVRTTVEFSLGHIPNSINIPLDEVPDRVEEIKAMEGHIILCCASGGRSGNATGFLQNCGVDCENGGGWREVKEKLGL